MYTAIVFANLKVGRFLEGANRKGGQLTSISTKVSCPGQGPRTWKISMLKTKDWSFLRRLSEEGKSARWIAAEFGLSRKTVSKYIKQQEPPKYAMQSPRCSPKLDPHIEFIESILDSDVSAPKKQHHTAKRIFDRLCTERSFVGSEQAVRRLVSRLKQRQYRPPIFIPLAFPPGRCGQVDFGEAYVCLGCQYTHLEPAVRASVCKNKLTKVQCFVLRLNYSRRLFVTSFRSGNMASFIAAHRMAFEHFGARPQELTYDNLTLAVKKVLKGREREFTDMFLALVGHYGFEPQFCLPGKEGAHQKGGVEGGIGYIRRNWLVPVPHVQDIEELNAYLLKKCQEDMTRTVSGQEISIQQAWDMEIPHLTKLPANGLDACVIDVASLDGYGMVRLDSNFYSIPYGSQSLKLLVKAYWNRVEITDGSKVVASHERSYGKQQRIFQPEHYFDLLERRPGAVRFAQPLLASTWPSGYWEYFEELVQARGQSVAGKEFVRILRLHSKYGAEKTKEAIAQARRLGATSCDAVQNILVAMTRPQPNIVPLDLTERSDLSGYDVMVVDLTKYDSLTGGVDDGREFVA
jgi:transposase